MRGHRTRARRRLLAAVGVTAAAVVSGLWALDALENQELDAIDARFSIRGEERPPPDLLIVAIDDVSFDELRRTWPFPRSLHARAIRRLVDGGARAIAYDVQFTEPTRPAEDEALFDAVTAAPRIVLGTSEVGRGGATNILGGDENLEEAGARAGNAVIAPDPDGVLRRFPLEEDGLAGFAAVAAELAFGERPRRSRFGGRGALIDFAGPPGTVRSVSFSRLVRGEVPAERIRDRLVLVGATAPTLQDVHSTSISGDELMSGVELQANAVDTARRGVPLRSASWLLDAALLALMAFAAPLASLRLGEMWSLALASIGLTAAFLVAAQLAFEAGLVTQAAYPVLALEIGTVGSLATSYVLELRERRRTRELFARFVPEQVVDAALAQVGDDLRLGGVRRDGTVMFCDLRGFTAFAEAVPAERVIEVLNRYLEEMSEAILDHGGTLVSYMGDGIMAVFGAPVEMPDHADRALAAAREMLGPRLDGFNRWLREEGLGDGFGMGVGINSGEVMSGNVGSARRMEYAAVGDTTNTAARLEALTKETSHSLLLSDSTHELLSAPDGLAPAGELTLPGRSRPVRAWTLASPEARPAPGSSDAPRGTDAAPGAM